MNEYNSRGHSSTGFYKFNISDYIGADKVPARSLASRRSRSVICPTLCEFHPQYDLYNWDAPTFAQYNGSPYYKQWDGLHYIGSSLMGVATSMISCVGHFKGYQPSRVRRHQLSQILDSRNSAAPNLGPRSALTPTAIDRHQQNVHGCQSGL